ncbi:MAG: diacylglycerol kinase family protein [Rubrobacter sp.]
MTDERRGVPLERKNKKAFIGGFDHAWDGIRLVIGSQRNMRFHVIIAVGVIVAGVVFRISPMEFALIALTITVVFAAEIVNTAIEAVVDLVSSERHHPLAKTAKDCAAGAVLICAVGAVVVGVLVFHDEVFELLRTLMSS